MDCRVKPGNDESKDESKKAKKKGCGTPADAIRNLPCRWHGRAPSGMRTPVGVPPRLSPEGLIVPKAQLQARLPGTRQERSIRKARSNRGAEILRRAAGVTRACLSQPRDASPAPVIVPGGVMPEAARERFATPPAGTALAPMARHASGPCPHVGEIRGVM